MFYIAAGYSGINNDLDGYCIIIKVDFQLQEWHVQSPKNLTLNVWIIHLSVRGSHTELKKV